MFRDNPTSINITQAGNLQMGACWMFGYSSIAGNGIVVTGTGTGGGVGMQNCVMGPGLSTAVYLNNPGTIFFDFGSLYLDPIKTNLNIVQALPTWGANNNPGVLFNYCTSFLPAVNPLGQSHSCLTYTEPTPWTNNANTSNSDFFGGVANVVGHNQLDGIAGNNSYNSNIYKVSGNTVVLNPTSTNPGYTSSQNAVYNEGATSWGWPWLFVQLCNLDFTLPHTSPWFGTGVSCQPFAPTITTNRVYGAGGFVASQP
jgi:hypothetical protein